MFVIGLAIFSGVILGIAGLQFGRSWPETLGVVITTLLILSAYEGGKVGW